MACHQQCYTNSCIHITLQCPEGGTPFISSLSISIPLIQIWCPDKFVIHGSQLVGLLPCILMAWDTYQVVAVWTSHNSSAPLHHAWSQGVYQMHNTCNISNINFLLCLNLFKLPLQSTGWILKPGALPEKTILGSWIWETSIDLGLFLSISRLLSLL